jgi:hypothetical protein
MGDEPMAYNMVQPPEPSDERSSDRRDPRPAWRIRLFDIGLFVLGFVIVIGVLWIVLVAVPA